MSTARVGRGPQIFKGHSNRASPALTPDVLRRIYAKGVRHGATSRQDGGIIDKANPTDGGFDGQLQSRN